MQLPECVCAGQVHPNVGSRSVLRQGQLLPLLHCLAAAGRLVHSCRGNKPHACCSASARHLINVTALLQNLLLLLLLLYVFTCYRCVRLTHLCCRVSFALPSRSTLRLSLPRSDVIWNTSPSTSRVPCSRHMCDE
jgi:hypothetical protein